MSKLEDLYKTLGVSSDASLEQIRLAYRRLAREIHPDHNPDDPSSTQRFSKLTQAYNILSDSKKRAAYDTLLKSKAGADESRKDTGRSLGSFFKRIFASSGPLPEDGRDLKTKLTVMLSDLVSGTKMHLEVPSTRPCSSCGGIGITAGSSGESESRPCASCESTGRQACVNKLEVFIPPGLEDGTTLKISGEGEPGLRGGKNGDLFVQVNISPHPVLERNGKDLFCEVPISLQVALMGGQVDVPGLEKLLVLKIPANTLSGKIMRLRGQGLPSAKGGKRGSLMVKIMVDLPGKLNSKQRSDLGKVLSGLGMDNYREVTRFLKIMKTLFPK